MDGIMILGSGVLCILYGCYLAWEEARGRTNRR